MVEDPRTDEEFEAQMNGGAVCPACGSRSRRGCCEESAGDGCLFDANDDPPREWGDL